MLGMTRTLRYLIACFVVLMGIFAPSTRAEVSLHAIFAKNAVLQRDKPLPVWGWADSLEKVTVTLGTQSATTTAGPDRRWRVVLGAQPMSKEP